MLQYSVLIVDGSAVMRRNIHAILDKEPQFVVVGIARTGQEAEEKIKRLSPDVVILDSEVTEKDSFTTLNRIMKLNPLPVLMVVETENESDEMSLRALELGATSIFLKRKLIAEEDLEENQNQFIKRIISVLQNETKGSNDAQNLAVKNRDNQSYSGNIDLVFIGTSTGGPSALQAILPRFPSDFPIPIIVDQHMPEGFTQSLATRFKTLCQLNVKEAEDNEILTPGTIYIAQSGFQTTIEMSKNKDYFVRVWKSDDEDILYKPCIDITLQSLAPIYRKGLLTVILTGMGSDGLEGCKLVKKYGGSVIIESEESCVVYGMPKVIYDAGVYDYQVPLSTIYKQIRYYV